MALARIIYLRRSWNLLHEMMFKLGSYGSSLFHNDETAKNVHRRWLDVQSFAVARGKIDDGSAPYES
jgi:hypothetical protein